MTYEKTMFVIRWKSDNQTTITNGWQINVIRHSEQKWYNNEPQIEILHKATAKDLQTMQTVL